ncbi:MetQ/NlpA family ABC transporter substrate-binding protein [Pleomorphomonas sp. JP5]|uniref:MetQ/NlpA family ABC transporter substrate-binding protein n=1 Tax=Pleomorphomonas sp. JP5 TaxID=2942998 RepID=UPI0020438DB7|nr:MetQ/NlpA family ABC transporter substrate-binding protein [Pleomorphomonas sp. JP5]MCM5558830.1 MetQ/NlpA family ABC transporter substrate-binding protein [Pleomorphomonas sp. JP5]
MTKALPFAFTRRAGLATIVGVAALMSVAAFASTVALAADKTSVKVGIMSGEDEDVWRAAAAEAEKVGLTLELVTFNDYTQPNEALERGEIDANAFQHKPYLDNQIQQNGYHIVVAGYTGLWPIGLYSKTHTKIADIKDGASIGVPNDPSNEGRALKVLEQLGLIKLAPGTGILATVADVVENPKNLEIKELDAGVVGRAIDDLDGAVVNTDWALKAGLSAKDRIAQEAITDNPYRNFIAVREADAKEPWVVKLVAAYQNPTVKAVFDEVYKGTGVAAY